MYCHQHCPRLHLCFATACYQTAGRSISRSRIHGIFGSHAAASRINYQQNTPFSPPFGRSHLVHSGITLLREFYAVIQVALFSNTNSSGKKVLCVTSRRVTRHLNNHLCEKRFTFCFAVGIDVSDVFSAIWPDR